MTAAAFSLVVLTLNVAGPGRIQQGWQTRRDALTARLKDAGVDAAAYQEVWHGEDLDALEKAAGHAYAAAAPALGLGVTSRLPIEASSSRDLGGGWGVLRARVRVGRADVDVYSARLEPGEAPAGARRLAQLFHLAEFVRAESSTHSYVLLGDLGVSSDEHEPEILMDLLEARDLCVSHGDEVCGRTLGEHRVDYALIPYSPRTPREYARTVFTDLFTDDEEPGVAHFGLRARLDRSFPELRPAAFPPGRDEALASIEDALENDRLELERRAVDAGWIPFLGTVRAVAIQEELARETAVEEEVRSARLRGVKRETPATPD
ncbi:MAG: endonuclease/exonuclease/phosphatase family protein [Elusimicrobia bacterium]|nr:endonuclease/exonuclease/phosphatase family protein [Elusimicrobiota bacterium]